MATWRNWSGRLSARPERIHHLRSEDDAVALAATCARTGTELRAVGAGHSHAPLVPTTGVIADASGLAGLIDADPTSKRAWVWAGTPIHTMGRALHEAGLALPNQGDIDRQSIGGAVATGTHGTGNDLTNLSALVSGARIALPSGDLVECSADELPDLWRAAQLSLGAIGVTTRLQLQLRTPYRLRQTTWTCTLDEILPELETTSGSHRHFELFWYPTHDRVVAKATDETTDAPEYPIGPEGARVGWSYEVLPNHRDWPHTEMEYSVPAASGPECVDVIRRLLAARFADMAYPLEYRTVAADDVWLSPAHGQSVATISVHMAASEDDEALFRACEEVFVSFGGRPHWGKVHYLSSDDLAPLYPHWDDWWSVRDAHDPTGVLLNPHLRAVGGRA